MPFPFPIPINKAPRYKPIKFEQTKCILVSILSRQRSPDQHDKCQKICLIRKRKTEDAEEEDEEEERSNQSE